MSTADTVISVLFSGSGGAILWGLLRLAKAVVRVISAAEKQRQAVEDNTKATERLAQKFEGFSATTQRTLADHGERITRLEAKIR